MVRMSKLLLRVPVKAQRGMRSRAVDRFGPRGCVCVVPFPRGCQQKGVIFVGSGIVEKFRPNKD